MRHTLTRGKVPLRVVDLLDMEPWLTAEGIGLRLSADQETVSRALYRLQVKGLVKSRVIQMNGGHDQRRVEWAAT